MIVDVYRGFKRTTVVAVDAKIITPEIYEIDCIECGGTGIWVGHPEIDEMPCVECKATGKVYIS